MASPRRVQRLQQLILETAAVTVQRELRDPRLGFVTLTHVKLAPDLTQATVFWSCLGSEAERRTSARALAAATPVVQSVVAKALATRTTPALTFRYDPSLSQAHRLETIFEDLKRERGEAEPTDAEEATDAVSDAGPVAPAEPPADDTDATDDAGPVDDPDSNDDTDSEDDAKPLRG
jgi:ribosome-binding factor A